MIPILDILGIGMKVLDKFFPDPEQKAKAQLELLQMQQNGELAKMQADMQEQVARMTFNLGDVDWRTLVRRLRHCPISGCFKLGAPTFYWKSH